MRGSEERVTETSSESEGVSEVECKSRGGANGDERFGLNGGKDQFEVFVRVEMG